MKTRPLAAVAVAAVMLFASACGGKDDNNSGERPSAAELATAFEEEVGQDLPDELTNCIGEGLHDSDLPNGVLRAIAEGREPEVDKDNLDDYESKIETIGADCATSTLGAGQ